MFSFFAAYWIVWVVLVAYVVRLQVRQQQLTRRLAAMAEILQRQQEHERFRSGHRSQAA